ncbi:MAG TPA: AAA family ATPase [Candidatus Limnocylindrales bacterium]|nr:AAA family ATPase [Candidatus Limnocylindrales bacterium]
MRIAIPDPALVVLVGAAGAGKSTFASRHFPAADVLSSDALRGALTGDEADQRANRQAFSILHREVSRRLAAGRTVVVDATNVERHARRALLARAGFAGVPAIAIVLALPPEVVADRNRARPGRVVDPDIVDRHLAQLTSAVERRTFAGEGFAAVHLIESTQALDAAVVVAGAG